MTYQYPAITACVYQGGGKNRIKKFISYNRTTSGKTEYVPAFPQKLRKNVLSKNRKRGIEYWKKSENG